MLHIPERREPERLPINLTALCWTEQDTELPTNAMILSLSTKGVGLISSIMFGRGATVSVDMTNQAKTVCRLRRAQVVHVRPFAAGNWIIGAEFLEPLSCAQFQELAKAG